MSPKFTSVFISPSACTYIAGACRASNLKQVAAEQLRSPTLSSSLWSTLWSREIRWGNLFMCYDLNSYFLPVCNAFVALNYWQRDRNVIRSAKKPSSVLISLFERHCYVCPPRYIPKAKTIMYSFYVHMQHFFRRHKKIGNCSSTWRVCTYVSFQFSLVSDKIYMDKANNSHYHRFWFHCH